MQKTFMVAGAVLVMTAAGATTVNLSVSAMGHPIGSGTYTMTILPNGNKRQDMRLSINAGGTPTVFDDNTLIDFKGQEIWSEQTSRSGGALVSDVRVTIAPNGEATVVAKTPKGTTTKTVAFDKRATRRDQSEFWFIRVHPKPGTWIRFDSFDLQTQKWVPTRTTFTGRKLVTLGGRKMWANLITQVSGTTTEHIDLDDHGMIVAYDANGLHLERR